MWMRKAMNKLAKPALGAVSGALALGCVWLASGAVTRDVASAQMPMGYNAAKVEALTRPCFGVLLDPRLRSCGGYGHGYYPYRSKYGYYGSPRTITVNCDTYRADPNRPDAWIERQIEKLPSYSKVRFISKTRSCVMSLRLEKSIILEGVSTNDRIPAIVARHGSPCIRIEPSADLVVLRNISLSSQRGDNTSCISSSGKELTLEQSQVRYDGDAPAVDIDAGRFNLVDSTLVARTLTAALSIRNAELFSQNSYIATTYHGLKANLVGDSRLEGITFIQLADWHGFERGQNARAIDITLSTYKSIISLNRLQVLNFAQGLHIEGVGEGLISNSLFENTEHAIVSDLDRVRILNNFVMAREIGIDVTRGEAFIGGNKIALVRTAGMLAKDGAKIRAVDNMIDADPEGCRHLKWGDLDPSVRTCTPWYKGSEFEVPGGPVYVSGPEGPEDVAESRRSAILQLFDDFWPKVPASLAENGYTPSNYVADPIRATN
ncbi:hypothetical protein OVA03_06695 [Asticcacaulis sp. SL142]|uniref:hypothetical protein n=1 Tax=Asticcacaulis sp. SL142 TaxID=2995155 RepID=UPI00226D12BE|nr:hypothetical protein [Asticcacaulis sp. SL142]WAC49586.1 hypothetical protein OVA03_06695 [Asticcacaulis sp. SL142]